MVEAIQHIFVVSDATGETAERVVRAALAQFRGAEVAIHRLSHVLTPERVKEAVEEAAKSGGFIVYTLVSEALRQAILEEGRIRDVATIDLLGPLLFRLSDLLRMPPLAQPGLFRQLSEDYQRRIEVLEFVVKHDDGQNLRGLPLADIVLVGVSRTSKTPLSIYLAGKGWRVANVPIVLDLPLPEELTKIDRRRVIGLTIKAERLQELRKARLAHLQVSAGLFYADLNHIRAELDYSLKLFRRFGWPIIDVTHKSIEETAAEVLALVQSGQEAAQSQRARGLRRSKQEVGGD